jgi:hypothetical protein
VIFMSVVGVLIIAALFFVVTMAVAVGPLLLCRIFAGPGNDERRPQPRRASLASGVLTFCGVVIGVGIGLFMLYFTLHSSMDRSEATIVYDDIAAEPIQTLPPTVMQDGAAIAPVPIEVHPEMSMQFTEHSLFAPPPPPAAHRAAPPSPDPAHSFVSASNVASGWSVVLVLVLVVSAIVMLASERVRAGLARMVPVVLIAVTMGTVFFWTFTSRHMDQTAEITVNAPQAVSAPAPPSASPYRSLVTATELQQVTTDNAPPATVAADEPVTSAAGAPAATQATSAEDSAKSADPPVLAYVGIAPAGVPQKALPKWTGQSDDSGPVRVIDSGLHATVQLAEEHALEKLKTLLQTEMVQRTPEAAGWQAPDEAVLNAGNILQRAVERTQIQVGENTIPMYEAYWQVDLGRLESLYRAWRPDVVQQRLTWIAGGVALLMLLLGSIAGFLEVDERTHGRRRKSLAAGTLALWAVVVGIAAVVA